MLTTEQYHEAKTKTELQAKTQEPKPGVKTRFRRTATPRELEALRQQVDEMVDAFFQAARSEGGA